MTEKQTFQQKWFPTTDDAETGRVFVGRWARTIVLGASLIYSGYHLIGNDYEVSKGKRTGMINKLSQSGLIWKSYEGQMALEGITSEGSSTAANVWNFSLDNQSRHGENKEELAKKLEQYLDSGTKVKVTYVEPLSTWPWRSKTDYLITSVEPVESPKEEKK